MCHNPHPAQQIYYDSREEVGKRFRERAKPLVDQTRDLWQRIRQIEDPVTRTLKELAYEMQFRTMWEEEVNEQFYREYPHLRPDPEVENRKVQERLAQKPPVLLQVAYDMVREQPWYGAGQQGYGNMPVVPTINQQSGQMPVVPESWQQNGNMPVVPENLQQEGNIPLVPVNQQQSGNTPVVPGNLQRSGQMPPSENTFVTNTRKPLYPYGSDITKEDSSNHFGVSALARAALDETELAEIKRRAEFLGLNNPEEFSAFEQKYLKAAESIDNPGKSGIILDGEYYVSTKGFVIHQDKIHKFLLQPGAKHYQEFFDVGYRHRSGHMAFEANLLVLDIYNGYDMAKITDRIQGKNGIEKFSIFMALGFRGQKSFRTVWQKDTPNSIPRLITAHRED